MNRREMLGIVGVVSGYTLTNQVTMNQADEPPLQDIDPWVGVYFKYARYDTERNGQFGEAQKLTISKDRDGYSLSKPYTDAHFKEIEKGVLADRDDGLGKIYLGHVVYADEKKESILRVEFCYERFYMCRVEVNESAKTSQAGDS
jgi:hypothetical protein